MAVSNQYTRRRYWYRVGSLCDAALHSRGKAHSQTDHTCSGGGDDDSMLLKPAFFCPR